MAEASPQGRLLRRVKERRSLSYITNSPLSFEGEGDKGGEVDK